MSSRSTRAAPRSSPFGASSRHPRDGRPLRGAGPRAWCQARCTLKRYDGLMRIGILLSLLLHVLALLVLRAPRHEVVESSSPIAMTFLASPEPPAPPPPQKPETPPASAHQHGLRTASTPPLVPAVSARATDDAADDDDQEAAAPSFGYYEARRVDRLPLPATPTEQGFEVSAEDRVFEVDVTISANGRVEGVLRADDTAGELPGVCLAEVHNCRFLPAMLQDRAVSTTIPARITLPHEPKDDGKPVCRLLGEGWVMACQPRRTKP